MADTGCPTCSGVNISPHPERVGFFKCDGCGAFLTRLRRRPGPNDFQDRYMYITPKRTGLTFHEAPKG